MGLPERGESDVGDAHSPLTDTIPRVAVVAQWIERPPPKRKGAGSIPAYGTSIIDVAHLHR